MLSIDTNLLFHALAKDRPEHHRAISWLESVSDRDDIALSEFVLVELYRLLRNPAVVRKPLSAEAAVAVIQHYRRHPRWRIVGFSADSLVLHQELWRFMAAPKIAYRRIYDVRLALTLLHQGVTELATANVGDFADLGFARVWNPLADQT